MLVSKRTFLRCSQTPVEVASLLTQKIILVSNASLAKLSNKTSGIYFPEFFNHAIICLNQELCTSGFFGLCDFLAQPEF